MSNFQNGNGGQQANIPPLNINLKDAETIVCEECGSEVFEEKMMIKKISKLLTGSDRDSITPIPVIACAKCGHVNELFKPKF